MNYYFLTYKSSAEMPKPHDGSVMIIAGKQDTPHDVYNAAKKQIEETLNHSMFYIASFNLIPYED